MSDHPTPGRPRRHCRPDAQSHLAAVVRLAHSPSLSRTLRAEPPSSEATGKNVGASEQPRPAAPAKEVCGRVEPFAADAVEALVVLAVQVALLGAALPEFLHACAVARVAAGADE